MIPIRIPDKSKSVADLVYTFNNTVLKICRSDYEYC